MATATKRKSLPEDGGPSNSPPTTKRLKGIDHVRRPDNSRVPHNVTSSSLHKKDTSSSTPCSSKPSTGSESDGSTSRSLAASISSSSSESNAEASEQEPESDDDSTSTSTSSSSSSSSDSSSSGGSPNILTLPIPYKPSITRIPPSATTSDLHHRLSTFLPNLAAANDQLEVERAAGRLGERNIETVDDQEYIEMNLGLGVLEEKGSNGEFTGSSGDEGSVGEDDHGDEEGNAGGGGEQGFREAQGETDVLGKLLRRKKSKVDIQVIDAGTYVTGTKPKEPASRADDHPISDPTTSSTNATNTTKSNFDPKATPSNPTASDKPSADNNASEDTTTSNEVSKETTSKEEAPVKSTSTTTA